MCVWCGTTGTSTAVLSPVVQTIAVDVSISRRSLALPDVADAAFGATCGTASHPARVATWSSRSRRARFEASQHFAADMRKARPCLRSALSCEVAVEMPWLRARLRSTGCPLSFRPRS